MLYIYATLLIGLGIFMAWFGQKKYNLTFATTYLISAILIYLVVVSSFDNQFQYFKEYIAATAISTIFIWWKAKQSTYAITYCILVILGWGLAVISFKDSAPKAVTPLIIASYFISFGIIYLLRKVIIKTIVGFYSGILFCLGLAILLMKTAFETGEIFSVQPKYLIYLVVFVLIAAVYFQFSPFANVATKEEKLEF